MILFSCLLPINPINRLPVTESYLTVPFGFLCRIPFGSFQSDLGLSAQRVDSIRSFALCDS